MSSAGITISQMPGSGGTWAFAAFDASALRPDGKVALLYQLYTPPSAGLGLRFVILDDGVPGPARVLTGEATTDGEANTASLGLDGRSRATVIFTRGTYPDTEFVWLGQVP